MVLGKSEGPFGDLGTKSKEIIEGGHRIFHWMDPLGNVRMVCTVINPIEWSRASHAQRAVYCLEGFC